MSEDDDVKATKTFFEKAAALIHQVYNENEYRFLFVAYSVVITIIGTCLFVWLQSGTGAPVTWFVAWFTSISAFSCTGLSVADISTWGFGAQCVLAVVIQVGSVPLCSAIPSLLRVVRLRSVRVERESQRALATKLLHINLAVVWCSVLYWFCIQAIAFVLLVGVMGPWWSVFHVTSGFNNAGFALDNRSFAYSELASNSYVIAVFIFLMPLGNTLFPVLQHMMVRGWRTLLSKVDSNRLASRRSRVALFGLSAVEMVAALDELLAFPHKYSTHLFTARPTLYLACMWIVLTLIDYLMFIPEYGTPAFLSPRAQWLQALFQTVTVRTTGFTVMDLTQVQLGHIAYWVLSMYLSAYPFMVSNEASRRADVKVAGEMVTVSHRVGSAAAMSYRPRQPQSFRTSREASVVVAAAAPDPPLPLPRASSFSTVQLGVPLATSNAPHVADDIAELKESALTTVAHQIGWLYIAVIIVSYINNGNVFDGSGDTSPLTRILFEVSSAYGTVGLSLSSLRAPTVSYSGSLPTASQFVFIVLMYFGKFRGLPQTIDLSGFIRELEEAENVDGEEMPASVPESAPAAVGNTSSSTHDGSAEYSTGNQASGTSRVQFEASRRREEDADLDTVSSSGSVH